MMSILRRPRWRRQLGSFAQHARLCAFTPPDSRCFSLRYIRKCDSAQSGPSACGGTMSQHVTLPSGSPPQLTLEYQLHQCQAALAEAFRVAHGAGDEGEGELTPELRVLFVAISVLLVLFAGLMAGLTLGLLSLDK